MCRTQSKLMQTFATHKNAFCKSAGQVCTRYARAVSLLCTNINYQTIGEVVINTKFPAN